MVASVFLVKWQVKPSSEKAGNAEGIGVWMRENGHRVERGRRRCDVGERGMRDPLSLWPSPEVRAEGLGRLFFRHTQLRV